MMSECLPSRHYENLNVDVFPPRTKRRSDFKLCEKAPIELCTFIPVSVTITWVTGLCRRHVELQTLFLLSGSFYSINFSLTLFTNTICAVFDFAADYIRSVFILRKQLTRYLRKI